ncbi:helix-turn-helix domain-containing protein [Dyadobacter sp. CY345]|uniref:helix-turn-helix domain-containing protein n=1 Tax=Dyadobacter sp. CY345 TaxID=2909335 RepID=UPI001F27AFCF|nr:helix-turn-helix domain-containing protein [Dyadobacter sp. CY345]MCF2446774.1 helix-turn-helix domain-containing protein [Dyadobacter sp. CY345]
MKSLSDVHRAFGLPMPVHPLISLIDGATSKVLLTKLHIFPNPHVLKFYKISYKTVHSTRLRYGQSEYDFGEGGLLFAAPNQVIGSVDDFNINDRSPFTLLIHPDFFLTYPLAKRIKSYGFFSYSANEALHLSDREKKTIMSIFGIIEDELNSRIDEFSQDVVIAQIELMLAYANRFYKRQFITRKAVNNDIYQKMEQILDDYFPEKSLDQGIPTVLYLSKMLNLSPGYLSDLLRSLTGQNAQQHIHNKLIEMAKEKLSTTSLSISEIAYELGFGHPQSFSALFKTKTRLTPLAFRKSFN